MTDSTVQTLSSAVNVLPGDGGGGNDSSAAASPSSSSASAKDANNGNNTAPSSPAASSPSSNSLILNGAVDGVENDQSGLNSSSSASSPKSNTGDLPANTDNNNSNDKTSTLPSTQPLHALQSPSPPSNLREMTVAFEEFRREIARLYAELANTQEVLDIFETQRQLLHEQMSMCICSGRDYHLERYRVIEEAYRRVMPIKRVIEPEQLIKASGASNAGAGAVEQYSDGILSMIDSTTASTSLLARYQPGMGKTANGQLLKGRRSGVNGGGAILTAKRPPREITCIAVNNNSHKSKVRSYLDRRAGSSNGLPSADSILASTILSSSSASTSSSTSARHVQLQQQQLKQQHLHQVQTIVAAVPMNTVNNQTANCSFSSTVPVSLQKGGGQIIIRKRTLLSPVQASSIADSVADNGNFRLQQPQKQQQQPPPPPPQFLQQQLLKKAKLNNGSNTVGTTLSSFNNNSGFVQSGQKFTLVTTTSTTTSTGNNKTAFTSGGGLSTAQQQQLQQRGVILTRRPLQVNQQSQQQQQPRVNGGMANNHSNKMSNNNNNRNHHRQNSNGELHQAEEEEEERLDQLNNALDQLLMGRYDALNTFGTPTLGRTVAGVNNNGDILQQDEEYEEDEEDESMEHQQGFKDEDEDDEDIIFLDEVQNCSNSTTSRNIAVPLRPKIVNISSGKPPQQAAPGGNTPSILGAALKTGFKPYPTNYSNGGSMTLNSATTPSMKLPFGGSGGGHQSSHQSANNEMNNNNGNVTVIPRNQLLQSKRPHLTNEERLDIINRLKSNESGARIARDYGITKQAVSAIKRRAQLMGDNFIHSFPPFPPTGLREQQQQSNSSSVNHLTVQLQQKQQNHSSPVTLTSLSSNGGMGKGTMALNNQSSFRGGDNSLVTRQQLLQQQKMANSNSNKQSSSSNSNHQLRSATSPLCLPVNPVAILKSQMAKSQGPGASSGSSTHNSANAQLMSNASPSARLKIDSKRLLLPRLLQGTETYQTYASTSKTPSETGGDLQPRGDSPFEVKEEDDDEEEVEGVVENGDLGFVKNEEDEDEEDEEEEFVEAQQQQQSSTRSGKPFSFSMRQAMLDAGQENQEEEEEDEEEEMEAQDQSQDAEEEMYYDPAEVPTGEVGSDEVDDVLLNGGEVDEEALALMAANMVGDEEDEDDDSVGFDSSGGVDGLHFNSSDDLLNMGEEDLLNHEDNLGGIGSSDDINNNPEHEVEDDEDEEAMLQQLYSAVDADNDDGADEDDVGDHSGGGGGGGVGLADEEIDPPLGAVDFDQFDNELML